MSFKDRLKKIIKSVAVLDTHVEEEAALLETRLAECEGCPALRRPIMQCRECGCFVQAKARLKNASCPLGKW